ncbi:MAG: OmpA family protein [Deltaproteobacteria bacterium]|jgi:outer membrane protein OmpA-like peptidoglycan-associated protein|nr:OmpA family protein [Deltaproteobacteria bacterium]
MKRCLQVVSLMVITILVYVAPGYADTLLLHNGDRFIGTVQDRYFALLGPYGQIVISNEFLKRISLPDNQGREAKLQTINNDLFNGTILNEAIHIQLQSETTERIDVRDIKLIMLDTSGPSHPILTTIFITQNNDRFSGKLINAALALEADSMTATYTPQDINRIEFTGEASREVRVLLSNGDMLEGRLKFDEFVIAPDSLAGVTVPKSEFSSIQFNARKLVLKEYDRLPEALKDGDGDGITDQADKCPHTPYGAEVDDAGCATEPVATRSVRKKTDALDTDGDGVLDPLDKCPQTPHTAVVDETGCWATPDIFFDFDSAEIKPRYHSTLEVIIAVLRRNPGLKIEIQGNTDNVGPESYNQMLSEKRALAVKEFMVANGVEPARLIAVGFGASRNVASNENDTGRALNRRIDFVPLN